jgi:hypothetical protein
LFYKENFWLSHEIPSWNNVMEYILGVEKYNF